MRPQRRQPTRLPHPWDSPGKNTEVGCHFLLQCMKVKPESKVTQLCPTLSDPMDRSLPGSSEHGVFQARVLEWGAIASSMSQSPKRSPARVGPGFRVICIQISALLLDLPSIHGESLRLSGPPYSSLLNERVLLPST